MPTEKWHYQENHYNVQQEQFGTNNNNNNNNNNSALIIINIRLIFMKWKSEMVC